MNKITRGALEEIEGRKLIFRHNDNVQILDNYVLVELVSGEKALVWALSGGDSKYNIAYSPGKMWVDKQGSGQIKKVLGKWYGRDI